ncbi:DNA polymerase III subunit delta' [Acholeplasma oculi]|uniref:DNA polymerase III, delta prime subunit n=1 Tax=Acholeplasma oculi TaxID=35623 RepID=A0A061AC42_9MOLU|nr:hypothetical protein [Acholeplasma oculi]CDR31398.1 DNA polymerase III, delta prime subunit [Acholeplasma oculi]SKC39699.1 DNA polymerase-3 subunit delta' [Acholeplasma oculi]SUT91898.1 DNA polymerase III subunit delta' [Acholeplasma oculi]
MNEIITQFKETIKRNRLSHLYLLTGSLGVTKTKIVSELAYLIFESHKAYPELKHQLESLNHPNYIYMSKEGLSIKKDQILDLQQEFSKTSLVDGPRVYVIEGAETMSLSAANSLLKFLEEPKSDLMVGFLLTDDLNQILPTIRSRSQVIMIHDDNKSVFIESLTERLVDLKDALYLSYLTKDIDEAMLLANDQNFIQSVEYIQLLMKHISVEQDYLPQVLMSLGQTLAGQKNYISFCLEMFSYMILDIIHIHMNQKVQFEYMKDVLLPLIPKISLKKAEKMIQHIQTTLKTLRLPVNITLQLQTLGIELRRLLNS